MVWQVLPEETLGRHSGAVPVTCSKSLGPPQPLGYMRYPENSDAHSVQAALGDAYTRHFP